MLPGAARDHAQRGSPTEPEVAVHPKPGSRVMRKPDEAYGLPRWKSRRIRAMARLAKVQTSPSSQRRSPGLPKWERRHAKLRMSPGPSVDDGGVPSLIGPAYLVFRPGAGLLVEPCRLRCGSPGIQARKARPDRTGTPWLRPCPTYLAPSVRFSSPHLPISQRHLRRKGVASTKGTSRSGSCAPHEPQNTKGETIMGNNTPKKN